ncbi:hypothetical protein [Flavobacterium sedimenticola]|uniref:DUF5723 domain-containing protein n=1 Tax=Flavobacterium sedimenticola TaxID=3043286 RepID=A0ABT6XQA1_9FLAO|nr:hypothetical protein [Flavobacterium sedimenticola]MDI9257261.1 hypothetical protein [Flavobacterium sedimenticola]
MKKIILIFMAVSGLSATAQEHFSGISTSNRVGVLNGNLNPAELVNLSKKFEVTIYGLSFNVSNNKIGFSDFNSDTDFDQLIFQGTEPVNARIDAEIMGPSLGLRWQKWGFAITTKAYAKFDMVDIDPTIGNAITNDNLILNTTLLDNPNNQRLSGTAYGELGLSAARTFFENDKHQWSAGVTLKLLFPGSYSNFGLSRLDGTITQNAFGAFLSTNQPATLNIAYSGSLADSFTNFDDYSKSIFGGLNGFSGDIGINYRWKSGKEYKVNAGLAIRNIGSMTFKDDNNASTNYILNIPQNDPLDLSLFDDVNNLKEVETILRDNGYLTEMPQEKDFKVKLPTVVSTYADFRIIPKFFVTAYLQQKLNDDADNEQITAPNIFSITPRVNLGFFEGYVPVTFHEISGTNIGLGFRLGGFYLGTSSMISALLSDSKQGDIYTGFRWAFL